MRTIFYITIIISIFFHSHIFSQNRNTSNKKEFTEIEKLIAKAKEIQKTNFIKYENLINRIDSLSHKFDYKQGSLIVLTLKTHSYIHNGKYNDAERLINLFFKSNEKLSVEYIQEMLYYKSLLYYFKSDLLNAKLYAHRYIERFKKHKPTLLTGLLNNLLAAIYFKEDDYEQAIKYCLEASKNFDNTNSKRYLLNTYSEIAFIYLQLNNYDLALKYANLSINKKELAYMNDPQSIAILKSNASHIYLYNDIDKAEKLLKESNLIFDTENNIIYKLYNKNREANIYYFKNEFAKTITISKKIINNPNKNPEIDVIANYNLGKSLLKLKKYKEALPYLKIASDNLTKGSIFEINKDNALKEYALCNQLTGDSINYLKSKVKYLEFKNRKKELSSLNELNNFNEYRNNIKIKELEKEKILKEIKIRNRNLIIIINIILATFLFIIILILIFNNKKKNKLNHKISVNNKKLLETQVYQRRLIKEKNILLKEIHHRVKNNLQLVASLLNLQFNTETSDLNEVLEKSQSRIASMALIHENLYKSKNVDTINFNSYCEELINNIKNLYQIDHKTIIQYNFIDIEFDIDTIIPLGLILNELITNIFKHAFPENKKGIINIEIEKINTKNFKLIIKDNGVGFKIKEKSTTLGMQLVTVLTNQLNGIMDINSTNEGTTITIEFSEI